MANNNKKTKKEIWMNSYFFFRDKSRQIRNSGVYRLPEGTHPNSRKIQERTGTNPYDIEVLKTAGFLTYINNDDVKMWEVDKSKTYTINDFITAHELVKSKYRDNNKKEEKEIGKQTIIEFMDKKDPKNDELNIKSENDIALDKWLALCRGVDPAIYKFPTEHLHLELVRRQYLLKDDSHENMIKKLNSMMETIYNQTEMIKHLYEQLK